MEREKIKDFCQLFYSQNDNNRPIYIRDIQNFRTMASLSTAELAKHKWLNTMPLNAAMEAFADAVTCNLDKKDLPLTVTQLLTLGNLLLELPNEKYTETFGSVIEKLEKLRKSCTKEESAEISTFYRKIVNNYQEHSCISVAVVCKVLLLEPSLLDEIIQNYSQNSTDPSTKKSLATVCLSSREIYQISCGKIDESRVFEFVASVSRLGDIVPLYKDHEQSAVSLCTIDLTDLSQDLKILHLQIVANELLRLAPHHKDSVVKLFRHFPAIFDALNENAQDVPEAARLLFLIFLP